MSELLAAASIIIFMIVIAVIFFAMSSAKQNVTVVSTNTTNVVDTTTDITTSSPVAVLTFPAKLKMPSFPPNPPVQGNLPQKNTSEVQALYQGTLNYINSAYVIYVEAYNKMLNQYNASIDKIEKVNIIGKTNVLAANFTQNCGRALEQYNAQATSNGYMALQLYGDYIQVVVKKEVQAAQPTMMGAPVSFNYSGSNAVAPSAAPSSSPSSSPSSAPSSSPSAAPSSSPSSAPSAAPSSSPSAAPSSAPSRAPVSGPVAISTR